ncbi:MAG: energy transducer TonB [Acetobacteraceae bacterium]|nr:energy transducer TonB [Acetobacteraceae bacterium]
MQREAWQATHPGRQAAWPPLLSLLLHGGGLAAVLMLHHPKPAEPPAEGGVEIVWQQTEDGAVGSGGDPAPAAPEPEPDPPPEPQPAAAPPQAAPPPPPVAEAAEPPREPASAPPLTAELPEATPDATAFLPPPVSPPLDPPPEAEAAPPQVPPEAAPPPPPPEVVPPPPPPPPVAEASPPETEPDLPLPPPPMPPAPRATAQARPAPQRPAQEPSQQVSAWGHGPQPMILGTGRVEGAVSHGVTRIDQRPPTYPYESRLRNEEGTVVLVLRVGTRGQVVDVQLLTSSGYRRLDAQAMQDAWTWRFNPKVENGQPVEATVRAPVTFRLTR